MAHRIEGLRFGLLTTKRAFLRVEKYCRNLESAAEPSLTLSAYLDVASDCWSVIDSAVRSQELLKSVSGFAIDRGVRKQFNNQVNHAKELRNIFQHFGSNATSIAPNSTTIFGGLSWISSENHLKSKTLTLIAGSLSSDHPSLIFDRANGRFISDFVFHAAGIEVSLYELSCASAVLYDEVERLLHEADAFDEGELVPIVIGFELRA